MQPAVTFLIHRRAALLALSLVLTVLLGLGIPRAGRDQFCLNARFQERVRTRNLASVG